MSTLSRYIVSQTDFKSTNIVKTVRYIRLISSGGSRIFLKEASTPKGGVLTYFLPKTGWKWKNWDLGGTFLTPPLDPPMIFTTYTESDLTRAYVIDSGGSRICQTESASPKTGMPAYYLLVFFQKKLQEDERNCNGGRPLTLDLAMIDNNMI